MVYSLQSPVPPFIFKGTIMTFFLKLNLSIFFVLPSTYNFFKEGNFPLDAPCNMQKKNICNIKRKSKVSFM